MVAALQKAWQVVPPPALALLRIGAVLGIKPPSSPPRAIGKPMGAQDVLSEVAAMGIPIMHGRPDDPMLELLDL